MDMVGEPLRGEVRRQRLVDALAARWNVRLLVIDAPGGYGKSTAAAQAVRDNALDPSGIDVMVRATAVHRSAADVLDEACSLVGEPPGPDPAEAESVLDRLVAAVAARSPNDVTLWIDDAHRLTTDEDQRLLADLIDALPANGHVAILGRTVPRLPIAKLLAADQALVLGLDDLRFSEEELVGLASLHGADAADLADTGGWPAMSRLAIVSREHSRDYVFDEVLQSLDGEQREGLAVAQISGGADAEMLRAAGVAASPRDLARTLPLTSTIDDELIAHDLWADFEVELVAPDRYRDLVDLVVGVFRERGSDRAAIEIAEEQRAWQLAATTIRDLLADGDGWLGAADAERWVASFPPEWADAPELLLFEGVRSRLVGGVGDGLDSIHRAAAGFAEREDGRGFAACLSDLGLRAWVANDPSILEPVFPHLGPFLRARDPFVGRVVRRRQASDADLAGDYAAALETYTNDVPHDQGIRHQATLHFFRGDIVRAAAMVDELVDRSPTAFNRRIRAMHHFMSGDPSLVVDGRCPDLSVVDNSREQPLHHVWECVVNAAFGRRPPADELAALPLLRPREEMFAAVGRALAAIVEFDDELAASILDDAIDRIGPSHPMVRGELLRFLPVVAVVSEPARAILSTIELEDWNAERWRLAELLRTGRAEGRIAVDALPSPTVLLSVFPLPWSIETIALAAVDDVDIAAAALDEMTGLVGPAVETVLIRLARSTRAGAVGAKRLLASVPLPPSERVEVRLFGTPSIVRAGATEPFAGGRTARLLAQLVVDPPDDRAVLAELLWPDAPADRAATSLRTAVRSTRKLLDGDREPGSAPFHLRDRAGRLVLADTDHLVVDVRDVARLLDLADALDAGRRPVEVDGDGDPESDPDAARRRAFELVRPGWSDVFDDLHDVVDAFRALTVRAVDGMCLVAERRLAADDPAGAAVVAASVVEFDPFVERAHAALIAAALATGDLGAAGQAVDECREMLDELGVDPVPGTQMLFRRYERRVADVRRADLSVGS